MTDCLVTELKSRIDGGNPPILLDVRQPGEVEIASIPGAIHIPMGDIPSRLTELEEHADSEVVVYCHHGMRSASVQGFLLRQGFTHVRNLIGGIDAWSLEVDPATPRY
ncbi:rhodanese [bacterium]|nr:rhodanese [bacterium]